MFFPALLAPLSGAWLTGCPPFQTSWQPSKMQESTLRCEPRQEPCIPTPPTCFEAPLSTGGFRGFSGVWGVWGERGAAGRGGGGAGRGCINQKSHYHSGRSVGPAGKQTGHWDFQFCSWHPQPKVVAFAEHPNPVEGRHLVRANMHMLHHYT